MEDSEGRNEFQKRYNDDDFWKKMSGFARKAGVKVVYTALKLFYAAKDPETPVWAKSAIFGALGYFIVPLDAIPDLTPMVGFSDDLGVLTMAMVCVISHITPQVEKNARAKLSEWFGDVGDEDLK